MARKDHFNAGTSAAPSFKIWDMPNMSRGSEEPTEKIVPEVHTPARAPGTDGPDDKGYEAKLTSSVKIEHDKPMTVRRLGDVGSVRIALRQPNNRVVEGKASRGISVTSKADLEKQHPYAIGSGQQLSPEDGQARLDAYFTERDVSLAADKSKKAKARSQARAARKQALLPNAQPSKRTKRIANPVVASTEYPSPSIPNPKAPKRKKK
jgi:hypothetical protein